MDLSIIIERNPWRKNRDEIRNDESVKEALQKKHKLRFEFNDKENQIVIGPRRSGKTTYFKLLIYDLLIGKNVPKEDIVYVSCEILKESNDIIDLFRFIESKYFFLDEITFVEGWEKAIKFSLDQGLLKDKVLYITGSSTAFLKKETFPGRNIKIVNFDALNFLNFSKVFGSSELKNKLENFKDIEELVPFFPEIFQLFSRYIQCGGFPKPAFELMEEGEIKQSNYDEIYSWFRGDILKLGKSEEISKALIGRVLETLTTPVSYNSIGNHVGVTQKIIREYIEILKTLLYIDFCYQFDESKKVPIFRKEKKIYFTDPFIVKMFEMKIRGKNIIDDSKMAELIVFNALKHLNENIYLIKSQNETDFLVNKVKIEVKWKEKFESRKNTILLSKKHYNKIELVYQVPLFILYCLAKNKLPKH